MYSINVNLNNLTDSERNELLDLVKRANNRDSEKFPVYGDKYYTIIDGGVFYVRNERREIDEARISIGACFKNREDAEFELKRLQVLHKMREIAGDVVLEKEHLWDLKTYYTLVYDDDKKIRPSVAVTAFYNDDIPRHGKQIVSSEVLFPNRNSAARAIQEIGNDTLEKYYFRIVD